MPSRNFNDLTGKKFGRLTVRCLSQEPKKSDTKWICDCTCGASATVGAQNLKRGVTRSCGCLRVERITTHGLSHTQEHRIWRGIMDRCHSETYSKSHPDIWKRYGGRGIFVAPEWHDFPTFYADMGTRPDKGMTVEREDNTGPYAPWNCVWANRKVQGRNRRDNAPILYDGQMLTLGEIMERRPSAVAYSVVNARIHEGWSLEDAFSYPKGKHRPKQGRNPRPEAARRREKLRRRTSPALETSSATPRSEPT